MLASLGLEAIGGRQWCAEITAHHSLYGYERRFLSGHPDYARATSSGSRGVWIYYLLETGRWYEVCAPRSWKWCERYFCVVTDEGDIAPVTREEVDAWLYDQQRRTSGRFAIDVLAAARQRITWLFDNVPRIYVSCSAGKDSTVLLHLTMEEAQRRNRRVGLLFVDLEAQYTLTIAHLQALIAQYRDLLDVYWVSLPLNLRNAVSQFEPQWCCWEPGREADWVRQPPADAITDERYFPFYRRRMEFEEFVPAFGHWYGDGTLTACLVGIRTDESLNRWRTIMAGRKRTIDGHKRTTWIGQHLYNAYPIYDWRTRDIWVYHGRHTENAYNPLYDRMHLAGLTIHQMRICQPYGDDQRKGLWLYQIIEPETWGRVVARVSGANQGALYAEERGNILGNQVITKPTATWREFVSRLLASMPAPTREHYENKIAVFLHWYAARGYPDGIPDDGPLDKSAPSWKRICKALLRNDYWMKGLSFSQHRSEAYHHYLQVMKHRRQAWGIF